MADPWTLPLPARLTVQGPFDDDPVTVDVVRRLPASPGIPGELVAVTAALECIEMGGTGRRLLYAAGDTGRTWAALGWS